MTSILICVNLGLTPWKVENYVSILLRVQHNAKCLGKIICSTRGRSSDLINAAYPFLGIANGSWWLPLDGFPAGWIQIDKRLKFHLSLILRLWIWCCVWHWVSWFLPIPLVSYWKECCTPWIKTPYISFNARAKPKKNQIRRPAGVSDCEVLFLFLFLFCTCFCSWLVLVPLFSSRAFLLRLNQSHPSPPYYYYYHYYYSHHCHYCLPLVLLLPLLLPVLRLLRRLLRLRLVRSLRTEAFAHRSFCT